MRTERLLWLVAVACASLLLFAPLTPRTTWLPTARSAGGSLITEGVGWLAIAASLGAAALGALVLGLRAHRRVPAAAAGAAVATGAFLVTAVGMGRYWIDLMNGATSLRIRPDEPWALHPAPFVPHFAVVAAAGAVLAFALTVQWLRPRPDRPPGPTLSHGVVPSCGTSQEPI